MPTSPSEELLDELISNVVSRDKRLTRLLRDPETISQGEWFMYLPRSFNDALDIRRTERIEAGERRLVWTQGAIFQFSVGDVIYDTPDAYQTWSEALKSIRVALQVRTASPVTIPITGIRHSGRVQVAVYTPNAQCSRVVERGTVSMTQDDLVRFIISGINEDIQTLKASTDIAMA